MAVLCVAIGAAAEDRPFRPTRERITFSSDRTPVDIEIAGSTSRLPNAHRLLPHLVLRLRLDRAYVYNFMTKQEPGFEILGLDVDVETRLPSSLFQTAAAGPKSERETTGIPQLPSDELRRRNILIGIHSDHTAGSLAKFRELALRCQGQFLGDDLWSYEPSQGADCPRVYSHEVKYIGAIGRTRWLEINCDKTSGPTWSRCITRFPFGGFAAQLDFSQRLLTRWREAVSFAENFLTSKRYKGTSP
jgi:hypothetical protein